MSLSDKTVLVTGATGFTGGALALRLAAEGTRVKALARSLHKSHFLRSSDHSAQIEVLHGDLTHPDRVRAVMDGVDVVIHTAVRYDGSLAEMHAVNVDGTRHIMRAAADAGVKRVVHISTIGIYGQRGGTITEDGDYQPGPDAYARTKSQAESVVREFGAARDLPVTIIRPGLIYGPGSQTWTDRMFKLARLPIVPILGDGRGSFHAIYIDDLVDLCVCAAGHPAAAGEAFNAVPDPPPTFREVLTAYARLSGRDTIRWLSLQPGPLHALLRLIALISDPTGPVSGLPGMLKFATCTTRFSMDKARDRLGWQPRIDLAGGIQRCAPWLRTQGLL